MNALKEIANTVVQLWSLVVGLKVTGWNFTRKQLTVHYPREQVDNISTWRGHIELVGKKNAPMTPKCITCMLCQSLCPSGCISVKKRPKPKPEAAPKPADGDAPVVTPEKAAPPKVKTPKDPAKFDLNFNTCSLCGLCVQNCPVDSLRFSMDVYAAGFTREEFEYDLIARLKKQNLTGRAD